MAFLVNEASFWDVHGRQLAIYFLLSVLTYLVLYSKYSTDLFTSFPPRCNAELICSAEAAGNIACN